MLFQAKEKMQVVKDLYHSRHYAQCAKLGERLIAEAQQETHPVHLAYLNFYTAISHDTLAREAIVKNRYKELTLAEKHYAAAISILKPPEMQVQNDQPILSPVSATSWTRRSSNASSFDSTASTASSVTSYNSDKEDSEPEHGTRSPARYWHVRSSSSFGSISSIPPRNPARRSLNLSGVPARPQSVQDFHISADTSDFIQAIQGHLANVRELKKKTAAPAVRFCFPEPQTSPTTPTSPISPTSPILSSASVTSTTSTTSTPRTSLIITEDNAETVRQLRRTVKFRQRFDPTSVRRLCSEALWELS